MANREGRFKKIRPRSTPNSTAHKHERCFQLKPHSYHPVLVCTFSQSWKTIRTKNCSNVFVRDLEQNFNIIIFKYISLITEHPTIFFLNFVLLPVEVVSFFSYITSKLGKLSDIEYWKLQFLKHSNGRRFRNVQWLKHPKMMFFMTF